jgi:DNA-binding XRE family transcriptional regulator
MFSIMILGKVLRVYRASQDIKQNKLADDIGIPPETLCRIEDGKGGNPATIGRIIAWLLGGLK